MLTCTIEKQQRWPIIDAFAACLLMDDRQREKLQIQWTVPRDAALPITADESCSNDEGVPTFGTNTKKWLNSKNLFVRRTAADAVEEFLSNGDR